MNSSHLSSQRLRWVGTVLLALVALYLLYFAGLGRFPLTDADEPVYGQVAQEMAHGDWLTPHREGQLWFDKPPLFYWLTAATTVLLGAGEVASRLPSALMAVALVLLVYALAAFDFGRRTGLLAAVVMATCLQQIVLAHAAVTDMTLAAMLLAALYGVRRWLAADQTRSRVGWALLTGAMVGLATLAKGPVAMVLVGLTLVVHLALTRRLDRLLSLDAVGALATCLVVAAPWYAAMYLLHGEQFVEGFLVANNVTRFLEAEHAEQTAGWHSYFLNVPVLALYFLPWSVFLPQSVAKMGRATEGARLVLTWGIVVLVFFSLSKTLLVTYIFPLFPAAAVLVGAWWGRLEEGDTSLRRGLSWGLGVGMGMAGVIVVALFLVGRTKFPGVQVAGTVLGLILLLGPAGALVGGLRRPLSQASRSLWLVPGAMVVFTLWLVFVIMPLASPWVSLKPLLDRLPPDSSAQIVSYRFNRESLSYYGGGRVGFVDDPQEVRRLLEGSAPVFVIFQDRDAEKIQVSGSTVWAREGRWKLVTNGAGARSGRGS